MQSTEKKPDKFAKKKSYGATHDKDKILEVVKEFYTELYNSHSQTYYSADIRPLKVQPVQPKQETRNILKDMKRDKASVEDSITAHLI